MVHPTLLLPFPSARALVDPLYPVWEKRLGPRAPALEKALPQAWREGLWRLLDQTRLLALRKRGFPPDPALTVVFLASPLDEDLEATLDALEGFFLGGESRGIEARLHLVLLLRTPEEFQAAARFPPLPDHPLPSRVWPLALWNRRGARLPREEHLRTWVQHFLEALLLTQAPLQPARGRDWMGLGLARMERAYPEAQELVPGLWEAIKEAGDGEPPTCLLPGPPRPASLSPYPPKPQREDCFTYPEWEGPKWEEALHVRAQEEQAALDEALLPLEGSLRFPCVEEALSRGPKALEALLMTLREAQAELKAKQDRLLEELDEGLGLKGQRARFKRLRARKDRGRPVDPEEFAALEALFQELDGALEGGHLEALLERDREARDLQRKLAELEQELAEGRETWNTQVEVPPPPKPQGFWARLRERFFPRSALSSPPSLRKRLCDEAWSILGEAHEFHAAYAAKRERYGRIRQEYVFLRALLLALAEEEARIQEGLERIQGFRPKTPSRPANPLVVQLPGPRPPRSAYRQEAQRLLREGILDHLWSTEDLEALEEELLEGARRLLALTPPPGPLNPSPEAWALLVEAATPQVPVRTWPEHRAYAYVLGDAQGMRWGEPYGEEPWREGEMVLLRMVYPLVPEDLWREGAEPLAEEGEPLLEAAPPKDDLRPNPLLDEVLGLL